MVTVRSLLALAHRHDGVPTLTAYLGPGRLGRPEPWGARLERHAARVRETLRLPSSSAGAVFDSCVRRLAAAISKDAQDLVSPAWFGVACADRSTYTTAVPALLPSLVTWDSRLRIAPILRAVDPCGTLVVVAGDDRVTLLRYGDGALSAVEPATGAGFPAARAEVALPVAAALRHDDWVVVVGAPRTAALLVAGLGDLIDGRDCRIGVLVGTQSLPRIRETVAMATASLRQAHRLRLVDTLVGDALLDGPGVLGREHVERALAAGTARVVVASERRLEHDASLVEDLVRGALDAGVAAEIADGNAGARLDQVADGFGACLGYPLPTALGGSMRRGAPAERLHDA